MMNVRDKLIQMFIDAKYDRENPTVLADKVMKLMRPRLFKKK